MAVDGDSAFALGRDKVLTSLDLDTGEVNWQKTVPAELTPFAAPQAADGVVYLFASGEIEAYRASDGSRIWSANVPGITEYGVPALDAEKVYVQCHAPVFRATGQQASAVRVQGCDRESVAISEGIVETGKFAQDATDGRLVDLTTGDTIRAGNLLIRWRLSQLRAERAETGERLWHVDLPRAIASPPLIVGRYLYVPTTPLHTPNVGRLLTFDLATGALVDELNLPGQVASGGDKARYGGPPSMTAAEGLLFLPVGYGIIALSTQGALLDTEITSGPEDDTYETSATFEFNGSAGATGFECSLDHATFASCTSPTTVGPLSPGDHVFEVRAIAAAQADSTPAVREFTVLETPPPEPELDTEIVSGPSDETTETSPEFAFSASETEASFECSLDDSGFSPCTNPTTVGPLAPGPHTLRVRSVLDSRVDPTPASRVFSVATVEETDPPEEPVEDPPADPIEDPPEEPVDDAPSPVDDPPPALVEDPPPTVLPGLGDLLPQEPRSFVRTVTLASRSESDFVLRLEVQGPALGRGDTVVVRGPGRSGQEIDARMQRGSPSRWSISRRTPGGAQLIDGLVHRVSKRGAATVRAGVVGPAGTQTELDRFRITGVGRAGAGTG